MRYALILAALACLPLLGGCAMPMPSAGPGGLYTDVQEGVGAGPGEPVREGRATHQNFLGIITFGDSSIEAAKAEGNITTVGTIDRDVMGVLGLYSRSTTVVRGE